MAVQIKIASSSVLMVYLDLHVDFRHKLWPYIAFDRPSDITFACFWTNGKTWHVALLCIDGFNLSPKDTVNSDHHPKYHGKTSIFEMTQL